MSDMVTLSETMDTMELAFQIAAAVATISTFLAIMLVLMICLPYCLTKRSWDRLKTEEVNFDLGSMASTINFNPENEDDGNPTGELQDCLLVENEHGSNPAVWVLDEDGKLVPVSGQRGV